MKSQLIALLLVFLQVTGLNAAPIVQGIEYINPTEIAGLFKGGPSMGPNGLPVAAGTLDGNTGYANTVTGSWILSWFLPPGSEWIAGRGDTSVSVWEAPNGDRYVCSSLFSCSKAEGWVPQVVNSSGQVGGSDFAGYAAVDGVRLANAVFGSTIWAAEEGGNGWFGSLLNRDGVRGDPVRYDATGNIVETYPCMQYLCTVTYGTSSAVLGLDGDNAVDFMTGQILARGFVTSGADGNVALSNGLIGLPGALMPSGLGMPYLTKDTEGELWVIGSNSALVSRVSINYDVETDPTVATPEPAFFWLLASILGVMLILHLRRQRRLHHT